MHRHTLGAPEEVRSVSNKNMGPGLALPQSETKANRSDSLESGIC